MGRAEFARRVELVVGDVDGDDLRGAGDPRALDELSPTPPQPMTTTLDPAPTLAVLTTAPKPVSTPQAMSEATSNGMSRGTGATWLWMDDDMLGEGADAHAMHDALAAFAF